MSQHSELIAFAVALLASLGLTVPIRQLALRYGMVDKPGPRKVHLNPIPLLGGIAIYLGFILAVLLTRHDAPLQQIIGILAGATLLALVGFLDDGGLLHHQVKLFVGMPLAAVFLIASGIRAQLFSQFIPGLRRIDSGLVPYGFVGRGHHGRVQHSGSYGRPVRRASPRLRPGFSPFRRTPTGRPWFPLWPPRLWAQRSGFCAGISIRRRFLWVTAGAMLLGFLMATLGLKIRPEGALFPHTWLVPVLILGVPIFDTTLVSISRARRGLLPFTSPGKDHTAHRLSNLGLGHRGAVLVMYALAILLGALALAVPNFSAAAVYTLAGLLVVGALAAVFVLEALPYERQVKLHKPTSAS